MESRRDERLRLHVGGSDRTSDRGARARLRGPSAGCRRPAERGPRGGSDRSCHSTNAQGPVDRRRRDLDGAAPRRRRARRLLRDLSRHHRAPARTRARRDALRRDAGARQDAEPRGHVRDDPRRGATSRAVRQLLDPGDPGKPPGDRERARLRRSRGASRSRLRPGRRDQPRCPGSALEAAAGLRRRVAPPALRERGARQRTHSRVALCPDDRRRSRHRRASASTSSSPTSTTKSWRSSRRHSPPRPRWRSRMLACSKPSGPRANRPKRSARQPSRSAARWTYPRSSI